MVNIAIQGICGRMGRVLAERIANRQGCTLVAGVDTAVCSGLPCPVLPSAKALDTLAEKTDVVIDFSLPAATDALLDWAKDSGVACVICTTGLPEATRQKMDDAARHTAIFYSANMSLGINLLVQLVKRAVATLQGFDIEIVEKHHRDKLDAPSGTALLLADAANQQAGGELEYVYERHSVRQKRGARELGISAVRGGSIVGEHEVLFAGPDEVVSLSHSAYSRGVFATGAMAAAVFLAGKPAGRYTMDQLMDAL